MNLSSTSLVLVVRKYGRVSSSMSWKLNRSTDQRDIPFGSGGRFRSTSTNERFVSPSLGDLLLKAGLAVPYAGGRGRNFLGIIDRQISSSKMGEKAKNAKKAERSLWTPH